MSIPRSRLVGFSAIIRKAGKEWVTSGADKGEIAAEVVETMQNALAILQFPFAPVQPTQPGVAPTTQDFAVSFAAELPGLGGEALPVDPGVVVSDQTAAAWVVPMLSVPGLLPVGLQAATGADPTAGDQEAPQNATVAIAGESLVPTSAVVQVTALIATENPSDAIDFGAAGSETKRAAEGPVVLDKTSTDVEPRTGTRPTVELAGIMSQNSVQAEALVPQVQGGAPSRQPPSAAIVHGPQTAGPTVKIVGKVTDQPAFAEAAAPVPDPLAPESPPMMPKAAAQPVDAQPASPLVPATAPPATEPLSDDEGPTKPTKVEIGPAPEVALKPTKLSNVEADVVTALTVAPTLPAEAPSPEPLGLTTFWERYFTDRSEPQPGPKLLPDQLVQAAAYRLSGAFGLMPLLVSGQALGDDAVLSSDDASASPEAKDGDGVDVAFTAQSPAPGPTPAPAPLMEPAPALTILPWSEGTADPFERLDSALSSLSLPSSVSTSAASPGAGGPLSLPVHQVALQLAGVLVQASDRVTELALAPEELGKVRLRMEQDAANPDRLTILIAVERPETLDLFRRHAAELAEAIRNAGYSEAHIDFGQQGHSSGGDQEHSHSNPGSGPATDEVAQPQYSPRMMAGATLDLRL